MHPFSKEALERPKRTIEAMRVLREKAEIIEKVTNDAHTDEVVVAVIGNDLSFGGVWTLSREDLARQVLVVEDEGGWSLTFSPKTTVDHIEKRCNEVAGIAQKRWGIMQRWMRKHSENGQE